MAIVGSAEIVLTARLDRLERELRQAERTVTGFSGRAGSAVAALGTKLTGLGAGALGIGAVTAGLYKLGTGAISASAQVESLKTRLTSLLGSQRAAIDEYARLSRLASTTPFTLQGVVEAGVTLRAFGEQNSGAAKAVADLAAFMGTDVVEAAQAYGRAFAGGAGAADILRERGVLTMLKLRTGIDDLTKLTLPEFRRVLFEALVDPTGPIAGSTDRLSRTWQGAMANMEDATFNLGAALGSIVTESGAVRDVLGTAIKALDSATASTTAWANANRTLIDQQLGEWASGATTVLGGLANAFLTVAGGANSAANAVADFAATAIVNPRYSSIQQQVARRMAARGLESSDLADLARDTAAGMSPMFEGSAAAELARVSSPYEPLEVDTPRPKPNPTPTGGADIASRRAKRTPGDYLGDVLAQQRDFAAAAESQIAKQIELLERQKGKSIEIAGLERERLQLIESTLTAQVALLKAQGSEAGELARAEADLANVQAELAAPAAQVADEFERATVAAERLGSTLSDDILGSVKQFTVGIAQGTANLKDFPRILSQATAGNVTSRIFDATFGAGGLFGAGTGAGDLSAFGGNIAKAFGADSFGSVVPADFVGPLAPGQSRAGTAGAAFSTAGGVASTALAGFSTGQTVGGMFGVNSQESQIGGGVGALAGAGIGFALGGPIGAAIGGQALGIAGTFIGDLFRERENRDQKARMALDEAFKRGGVFPTLTLAKEPFGAFREAQAPGFAAGMSDEFTALSLLVGLTGSSATEKGPRNLGRRAGFLGLTEEQAAQQNRAVARATGKDVAEGVNDITVAFLRYQQEGKGAEITQAQYNETVLATVKLLQDDLPAGIDASVFALDSLEQFGQQQIVNLENLSDALSEVADAAQGFASAFAEGLGRAVASGDVMDVSRSLAEAFTSEFQDAAVKRILESGVFAADLQSAIQLTTDAAAKAAAGDFAGAAVLQARLGDTFSAVAGKAQAASAPLVAAVRGFEASLGVASASAGVIRQQPVTLVVQNVVDGRVVSESQYNTERLQRGGGVIVPSRVGRA